MISNWMCTEGGTDPASWNQLFASTIRGKWGMVNTGGRARSHQTIQSVDYTTLEDPSGYGDCWVVRDALISDKKSQRPRRSGSTRILQPRYDHNRTVRTGFYFVAGPNCQEINRSTGSMPRTRNKKAVRSDQYAFVRSCVQFALRAAFDAMIHDGVTIAVVARLSCGVYGGTHKTRLNAEFEDIVNEVLSEPLNGRRPRGCYFKVVVMPVICGLEDTGYEAYDTADVQAAAPVEQPDIEEAEAIADRVGVINQGEIIVVDETKELLKKMGHKKLKVDLQDELLEIPSSLNKYNLELGSDNKSVNYKYNVRAKSTGITNLLQDIKDAGLKLQDLKTEQTTLEKIFVALVKENNEI